jgi:hypothetical protein
VASIRTWSLPLPVQPWAIVSQPLRRAYSTASSAISGRPSALALIAGTTKSVAKRSRASTTWHSSAPSRFALSSITA